MGDVGEELVLRAVGKLGGLERRGQFCRALDDKILQVGLMLFQLLLDALAFGDILLHRDEMRNLAGVVENRRDRGFFPDQVAVLAAVAQDAVPGLAGENGAPQIFVGGAGCFFGLEDARRLANGFLAAVSGNSGEARIDVLDHAHAVGDDNRNRALLQGLFQLAAFLLGAPALGNVGIDPDAALVGICGIDGAAVQGAPEHAAVLVPQHHFAAVILAFTHRLVGDTADVVVGFAGVVEIFGRFAEQFARFVVKDFLEAAVA